jgi:hypothetical protein
MVLGEVDGYSETWGVYKLADIFTRHNASATFFIDVYEKSFWGEGPLKNLCRTLSDQKFDIQLHTHPGWRDDPHDFDWLREMKCNKSYLSQAKDFMVKLSVAEQTAILMEGAQMIEEWTGRRPVAHRSGGYSINKDTLTALNRAGFRVDSSMHWGHPHSEIAWSRNQVLDHEGVLELPVTLIDYVFSLPLLGVIYRKSMKTDLDTCSLEELLSYVHQAKSSGVKIMNLFMHSYSLLEFDADYKSFRPQRSDEVKLNAFLHAVNTMEDVRVMDCATILRRYSESPHEFLGSDFVPEVCVNSKIAKLAIQKLFNITHESYRRYIRVGR